MALGLPICVANERYWSVVFTKIPFQQAPLTPPTLTSQAVLNKHHLYNISSVFPVNHCKQIPLKNDF